ncbi:MAG: hypothetical protein K9G48_08730 [Reyranella sp.]|nr:hypothetical protein [Reyranella sp.]
MSNVRYRHIVRDYERRFRHQVRLPRCRLWRMGYVDGQLDYLDGGNDFGAWHVGDERRDEDVGVYGFKCPVHAAILQDWSTRCGIEWSIPPEEQTVRPPRPPRRPWKGPPPTRPGSENLHGLAGSGRPLGVTCKACNHRALVPLDRIGAHSGNMQEVRTLKLKCGACNARQWTPRIFHRDEDIAAFLEPTASTPAF